MQIFETRSYTEANGMLSAGYELLHVFLGVETMQVGTDYIQNQPVPGNSYTGSYAKTHYGERSVCIYVLKKD